jgi:ADP-ribose pyrophosphatase
MPPTQDPIINSTTDLSPSEARWLTLKKISFTDQTDTPREWEVAVRKTTAKSGVDAVAIGNILIHPSKPPSTLLVIQYRPPLDKYTVEWPAGLVDADESAEQAAEREMKEETGYEGKIIEVGPVVASDPGMTSSTLQLVMMEVQLRDEEGKDMPEQRLDDGELIERVVVPLDELYDKLCEWSRRERWMVAGKLFYWAAGMHFARQGKYFGES